MTRDFTAAELGSKAAESCSGMTVTSFRFSSSSSSSS
eukprot:CAMPEP_0197476014 /NCGR_PEP_ID=MMETSP1309-20131121/7373_1 /TAXON_ID=464262 /ORGANISM="Genus nov. species nov., Strain RCC998" /LENGTH=36 /DNA_ID= /DNA_START= /DNA_END= /DNA_ORIENTATION=